MFPRKNKLDRIQAKKSNNRDKKRYYSHYKTLENKIEETQKAINSIQIAETKAQFNETLKKINEEKRNTLNENNKNDIKQLEKETEHLRIAATWVSKIKTKENYESELEQLYKALKENKLNGELTKTTILIEEKIKQNNI
jgi:hypothetical protein